SGLGGGGAVTHGPTQSHAGETADHSPDVSGQFRVTTFPFLDAVAFRTSSWTPILQLKKRHEVSAHLASPLGPGVYGMRAFPESPPTSGTRTIVGIGRTTRLNFPSSVDCVDWRGGSGAGSHRSLHEFWQDLTAGIPGAAHDGIRPRHPALRHSRPSPHRRS
ncbi:peptide hydrolase, partial [Trypanosoma cruzi]